jgi:hypothetical protein
LKDKIIENENTKSQYDKIGVTGYGSLIKKSIEDVFIQIKSNKFFINLL